MATKLPDTLAPMGDYPVAHSEDIDIELTGGITKSIQQAYEDGDLGGEGGGGEHIQYITMPEPSLELVGKVYQYVGTTSSSFIKGYFYTCRVVPESDPEEYEWTPNVDNTPQQNSTNPITSDAVFNGFKNRLQFYEIGGQSTVDLNSQTNVGIFTIGAGTTINHTPENNLSTNTKLLLVVKNEKYYRYLVQYFVDDNNIWMRYAVLPFSTWNEWIRVSTSDFNKLTNRPSIHTVEKAYNGEHDAYTLIALFTPKQGTENNTATTCLDINLTLASLENLQTTPVKLHLDITGSSNDRYRINGYWDKPEKISVTGATDIIFTKATEDGKSVYRLYLQSSWYYTNLCAIYDDTTTKNVTFPLTASASITGTSIYQYSTDTDNHILDLREIESIVKGLGTASTKDSTNAVTAGSTDLVESGAVKTAIDTAVSSAYKASGNKTCAELTSSLLIASNLGKVYNITNSGTTTTDFVNGAGKAIHAGDNVAIVDTGSSVYKFDLMAGFIDLSNYVQKSVTEGLIKNDGTIDTTAYAKQSEMSVTNGSGADADKTTIQLKSGTSATVLKAHQDISGKMDKVSGATANNLASLNASGEAIDSGKKASDFAKAILATAPIVTSSNLQSFFELTINTPTGTSGSLATFALSTRSETFGFLEINYENGSMNKVKVFLIDRKEPATTDWLKSVKFDISANKVLFELSGNSHLSVLQITGINRTVTVTALDAESQGTWADGEIYQLANIDSVNAKADLVASATNGDLAGLDANGNLTDSGIKASLVLQQKSKAWSASHLRYILLGTIPISTGAVSRVSFRLGLYCNAINENFPVGTAFIDISSGSNENAFSIKGFTDINLMDSSNTQYPNLIVSKDSTKYYIYLTSTYNYMKITYSVYNTSQFTDGEFAESAEITGTEIYNSSTDTTNKIVLISSLQPKTLTTPVIVNGSSKTTVQDALTGLSNGRVRLVNGVFNTTFNYTKNQSVPIKDFLYDFVNLYGSGYTVVNFRWAEANNFYIELVNGTKLNTSGASLIGYFGYSAWTKGDLIYQRGTNTLRTINYTFADTTDDFSQKSRDYYASSMQYLGWAQYAGNTLADSVLLALNTTYESINSTHSQSLRGTWTGQGYWNALISPPRTTTNLWTAEVQYTHGVTTHNALNGIYIVEFLYDASAEVGEKFTFVDSYKLQRSLNNGTENNIVSIDANGNIKDSGKSVTNFMNYKTLAVALGGTANGWIEITNGYTGSTGGYIYLIESRCETAIASLTAYNNASITTGYHMDVAYITRGSRSSKLLPEAGLVDTTNKKVYIPCAKDDSVRITQIGGTRADFTIAKVTELPTETTTEAGKFYVLYDAQQKTLTTPLTVNGTEVTTVEGALGAINTSVSNKMPKVIGSAMGNIPIFESDGTISDSRVALSSIDSYLTKKIYKLTASQWLSFTFHQEGVSFLISYTDELMLVTMVANETKTVMLNGDGSGMLKFSAPKTEGFLAFIELNTDIEGYIYVTQVSNEKDDFALSVSNTPTDSASVGTIVGFNNYYTKAESDAKYAVKQTTLAGYGITNAYTKTEVSNLISPVSTAVSDEATARTNADDLLSTRIDALATLEQGSTTGDAELIDARTNYQGHTSANLGTSIRETEQALADEALWASGVYNDEFTDNVFQKLSRNILKTAVDSNGDQYSSNGLKVGYTLDSSGAEVIDENSIVTGFIPFTKGVGMYMHNFTAKATDLQACDTLIKFCVYNSSFTLISANSFYSSLTDTKIKSGAYHTGSGYFYSGTLTFSASAYSDATYFRMCSPMDYFTTSTYIGFHRPDFYLKKWVAEQFNERKFKDLYNNYVVSDTTSVEKISGYRIDTSHHWVATGTSFIIPINTGDSVYRQTYASTVSNMRGALVTVKPTLQNIVAESDPEGFVYYFGDTKSTTETTNYISDGYFTSTITGWLIVSFTPNLTSFSNAKMLLMINGELKANKFEYAPSGIRHIDDTVYYSTAQGQTIGYRVNSSHKWTSSPSVVSVVQIPVTVGDRITVPVLSGTNNTAVYVAQLSSIMLPEEIGILDPNTGLIPHYVTLNGGATTEINVTISNENTKYVYICPNSDVNADARMKLTTKNGYKVLTNCIKQIVEPRDIWYLDPTVKTDLVSLNGGDLVLKNKLWNVQMGDTGVHDAGSAKDILTILHFSDIHGNRTNLTRLCNFASEYSSFIDLVVSSGDQVSGNFVSDWSFWSNNTWANQNILFCMGNHDLSASTTAVPDEDKEPCTGWSWDTYVAKEKVAYDRYYLGRIENWEVTQPDNAETNGYCYFYKDCVSMNGESAYYYKIRIIFIDIGHQTDTQKAWFTATLTDARTNGFSVIVVSHFEGAKHASVPTPFCSREWGTQSSNYPNAFFYTEISTFIDNGGEFICWLTGHTHDDDFGRLSADTRQCDSNISTASDFNRSGDHIAKTGLRSQDCFNVMGIDTVDKVIKIMRVGRNYDRYMQNKDTMCYNYSTCKLLYPNHE